MRHSIWTLYFRYPFWTLGGFVASVTWALVWYLGWLMALGAWALSLAVCFALWHIGKAHYDATG